MKERSSVWLLLISLSAMFLSGCMAVREEPVTRQIITFDSAEIGKTPPDFTTALTGKGGPVSWGVREDAQAPGVRRVLIQESCEVTNYRFPVCVYDKVVARDVAAEVRFKTVSGTLDQAGGIVLRYRPENYYIARANALENNVIFFKTVNGRRSKIKEVPVKVTAREWHTLRFEVKGRRIKIDFDGQTAIQMRDYTFANAGKVGFWTKADSVTAFADLKIEPVP